MKNPRTNSHFKDEYGNSKFSAVEAEMEQQAHKTWDAQQRRIQETIWERQAELRKIEMEAPQARIVDVDSPEGQFIKKRLQKEDEAQTMRSFTAATDPYDINKYVKQRPIDPSECFAGDSILAQAQTYLMHNEAQRPPQWSDIDIEGAMKITEEYERQERDSSWMADFFSI